MRETLRVPISDLVLSRDTTRVECFGGPDDGRMLPVNLNGCREGGMYIPVNDGGRCIGKRWVQS